jgi:hypothetical protein
MSSAEISANPLPAPVVEKKPGVRHILDNIKYPDYIRNHAVFNKLDKIAKVFPSIGLSNTSEECPYSNIVEARTDAQNLLYTDMRGSLYTAMGNYGTSEALRQLLSSVYTAIGSYYPQMITEEDGRLALKFTMDIGTWDSKPFARKGESVFKVYNKLVEKCKAATPSVTMTALEAMPHFKAFSSTNVPGGKKFKTVFAASGQEGAWDIATISMRGISSCQGWGSPQSRGLIGSISSKYVGVLYITSGDPFNEYGSKMLRRAMVRFCINKTTKKPALLVDRVYPGDDLSVRTIFREFLKTKITIPVLFPGDPGWADYCLPVDTYWKAAPLQPNEYTYMDTKIPWKNTIAPKDVAAFYQGIAHLDTAVAVKVHNTLSKMLDEYCIDKQTHRDKFKGGVANLILSMKKNLGSHSGFMGHFLPKLYGICSAPGGVLLPKPENFEHPKAYEKAVIKGVFKNMKTFDAQTKEGCMKMGKFMKFFPTSAGKLTELVISEYKKELVNRYRELMMN